MSDSRARRPRFQVALNPDVLGTHQWSIYSGLVELVRSGDIEISMRALRPAPAAFCVLTHVLDRETSNQRLIAWEMQDEGRLDAWDADHADYIFKRSFDPALEADGTYTNAAAKVRPLGLTIGCTVPGLARFAATVNTRLTLSVFRGRYPMRLTQVGASWWANTQLAYMTATRRHVQAVQERLSYYESFQGQPVAEPYVTFLVRAWDPAGRRAELAENFVVVNQQRAEMIRLLRSELGPRFVGGFVPTEHAQREFADCVAKVSTARRDFVATFAQGGIGISTRGLLDSNPWKLAEYLATGTAVVSESLAHTLPEPLVENESVRTFTTEQECLARCTELLDDPEALARSRTASARYWQRYTRPDRMILGRLHEAFR